MRQTSLLAFGAIATTLLIACAAAPAQAADTCDLRWHLTARLDAAPRRLDVELSFPREARTSTELRLPAEWAGVDDYAAQIRDLRVDAGSGAARIEPLAAGDALGRRIVHAAGERVTVRFSVVSPVPDPDARRPREHRESFRTALAAEWFRVFGHALPRLVPWEHRTGRVCFDLDGLPSDAVWATSFGLVRGGSGTLQAVVDADRVDDAVFTGGRLQIAERAVRGGRIVAAMPPRAPFKVGIDAFADGVTKVVGVHRDFWRDDDVPFLLVALFPNHHPQREYGGTALYRAISMHGADDFDVPGAAFDSLVGHENLHAWIPRRFGAMEHAGVADEPLRYWFSEGFTDFYTHRLLVKAGVWSLDDYARALSEKIDRYRALPTINVDNRRVLAAFFTDRDVGLLPYARGEFLALRWHAALLAGGHGGLDPTMRALMLPAARAPAIAPTGAPLVTDRLLRALAPLLGANAANDDVAQFIDAGTPFVFTRGTLGPCFDLKRELRPQWQLGFDRASLQARVVSGLQRGSAADAAGVRDGMALLGASIYFGDIEQDVQLQVADAPGGAAPLREIRYRPVAAEPHEYLRYEPVPRGLERADCRAWMAL